MEKFIVIANNTVTKEEHFEFQQMLFSMGYFWKTDKKKEGKLEEYGLGHDFFLLIDDTINTITKRTLEGVTGIDIDRYTSVKDFSRIVKIKNIKLNIKSNV